MVLYVFKVTKHQQEQPQCLQGGKNEKKSYGKQKLVRTELEVGQRVICWNSRLKVLLGMFRCKAFGPYTTHKICEDESVEVKGKEIRASPHNNKASKNISGARQSLNSRVNIATLNKRCMKGMS